MNIWGRRAADEVHGRHDDEGPGGQGCRAAVVAWRRRAHRQRVQLRFHPDGAAPRGLYRGACWGRQLQGRPWDGKRGDRAGWRAVDVTRPFGGKGRESLRLPLGFETLATVKREPESSGLL